MTRVAGAVEMFCRLRGLPLGYLWLKRLKREYRKMLRRAQIGDGGREWVN